MIDIGSNGEELDSVDYERESTNYFSIFKSSQCKTLFFSFLFFFLLEGSYVYTAVKSPPYVNTTTFFYPITHDISETAADVFVHLEKIERLHEFFRMDGAVVRKFLNNSASDPLEISSEISYARNDKLVRVVNSSQKGRPLRYTCKFDHGAEISNRFLVLNEPIRDFDSINISLLINSTNFKPLKVSGFSFRYSFAQPNLQKYTNSIRFIFLISTLFVLGDYIYSFYSNNRTIFARSVNRENSNSNYIFPALIALLGIMAFLSLNPIELLYTYVTSSDPYATDATIYKVLTSLSPILLSLYMTVFKLFTYCLIDTTIHNKQEIDKNWALLYGIFILLIEIIETCAGLPNADIYKSIIKNGYSSLDDDVHLTIFERFNPILQLIYCVTTLLLLAYSYRVSKEENKMKFISYALFILLSLFMTFISEVFLSSLQITKNTSISFLFYHTSHLISTILFLYFQDTDTGLFQAIGNKEESHQGIADNGIAPDFEYDNIKFERTNDSDKESENPDEDQ